MNYISIANETIKITKEGRYIFSSQEIRLPDEDYEEVIVISPRDGQKLIEEGIDGYKKDEKCRIRVINSDSFQAGRQYDNPLVMNFANAHSPGGGFRWGAKAQEEALCRCSTLYASITSKKASEMYIYNNTHPSRVESDYMLISPKVAVFRDERCEMLETPVMMSVVTVPAPNRRGAALIAGNELIEKTFLTRIRIMLAAAAKYGYKNIILGAWGCGAFGNKPEDVAGYFKKVIVDEDYGRCFDEICFAIYGHENGRNITMFRDVFPE